MVQNTESFHFDLCLPSVPKSFRFTAGTETAMPLANIDEHKDNQTQCRTGMT